MQVRYQAALRPDPQRPEVRFAKESRARDGIPQVAEDRSLLDPSPLPLARPSPGGSRTFPRSAHRIDYLQCRCDSDMRMIRLQGLALAPGAMGGVARHLGGARRGHTTLASRIERFLRLAVLSGLLIAAVAVELRSSVVQSRLLSFISSRLTYTVGSGRSPRIVFPRHGPFDVRRGYARIPGFEQRLTNQGYRV